MIDKLLTIGEKIELRPHESKGKTEDAEQARIFLSQLLDVVEESKIRIAMPTENGRLVILEEGNLYELVFFTEKGMYQCVARVEARYRTKQFIMAEMLFLSPLEKCQRRQYFRLNCILDMTYWEEENALQHKPGVIIDISGGGARFNSMQQHKPGVIIQMHVDLPGIKMPPGKEIRAKIISSEELPNNKKIENRVEFLEMDKKIREGIVKYIFDEERKRRRRD